MYTIYSYIHTYYWLKTGEFTKRVREMSSQLFVTLYTLSIYRWVRCGGGVKVYIIKIYNILYKKIILKIQLNAQFGFSRTLILTLKLWKYTKILCYWRLCKGCLVNIFFFFFCMINNNKLPSMKCFWKITKIRKNMYFLLNQFTRLIFHTCISCDYALYENNIAF